VKARPAVWLAPLEPAMPVEHVHHKKRQREPRGGRSEESTFGLGEYLVQEMVRAEPGLARHAAFLRNILAVQALVLAGQRVSFPSAKRMDLAARNEAICATYALCSSYRKTGLKHGVSHSTVHDVVKADRADGSRHRDLPAPR
jgi:hypothetical protein